MDPLRQPRAPEYALQLFADPIYVKEVVKAILHTIFFHRYFIPITPTSRDLFDLTFPVVEDNDLETLIDQRATSLVRAVEMPSAGVASRSNGQSGRAMIELKFFETKKRRKGYFFTKADEEVCWETWTLDVTCATPRNDTGMFEPTSTEYADTR
jgi:autophagy-related protein 101